MSLPTPHDPPTTSMHIGIIGTGAMATLFASRLAATHTVTLIGSWTEQIMAIQQNGLCVTELDQSQTIHQIAATAHPATIAPVDLAIVLTKSYQTEAAAQRIAACLAGDGVVLTLQNGLGNLETLTDRLRDVPVTAGVTTLGATTLGLGHVRYAGAGVTTMAISAETHHALTPLTQTLNQNNLTTQLVNDILPLLWGKIVINASINPLTALLHVPNGFLATNPTARRIMQAAASEVTNVAYALKLKLPYNDAKQAVLAVVKATANNRSSMLQDFARGAPTEIDAICGEIIRIGQALCVPTPINQILYERVISAESQPQPYHPPHNLLSILETSITHNN